ncbi:MAG: S1C family serine protease [Syntrophomonadaceae bacterium]|nr:S1C family serine protease [Syntrophomonadaceae bacterium]
MKNSEPDNSDKRLDYPDTSWDENESYMDWLEDDNDSYPSRIPLWLRITALITVLAFAALIAITYWPNNFQPIGELLLDSSSLKETMDKQLLEAVVKIEAEGEGLNQSRHGTGFNIEPDGVIITNHHVIENASRIIVRFPDGIPYKVINWDSKPEYDLAVLHLEKSDLPYVALQHEVPVVGDQVMVVGNPLGLNNVVVEGTVGAYLNIQDKAEQSFSILAPIYPGNSGSPVYNQQGKVVGVVFATYKADNDNSNEIIGLAMPVREILAWD